MELKIKHTKVSEGSNPYDLYYVDVWKVIKEDQVICKCDKEADAKMIVAALKLYVDLEAYYAKV